jgi:hypothetical protein
MVISLNLAVNGLLYSIANSMTINKSGLYSTVVDWVVKHVSTPLEMVAKIVFIGVSLNVFEQQNT